MKLFSWYKNKSLLVKVLIAFAIIVLLFISLMFSYLLTYHYFSGVYILCDSKIEVGMSRDKAKELMEPLVQDSFINYGFSDKEIDLYLMDERGVYCKVKIEDDKVADIWWGADAP